MMPAMGNLSYINYAITCCVGGHAGHRRRQLPAGRSGGLFAVHPAGQPAHHPDLPAGEHHPFRRGRRRAGLRGHGSPARDRTRERSRWCGSRRTRRDGSLAEADFDTGAWAWKKPDGTLVPLRGDVRFDHVVFGYDDRKIILHDISLFAKPGQKIAFVGSTGAGKTTITSLINRFYEIQSGTITYDGIDVRDIRKDSLRRLSGRGAAGYPPLYRHRGGQHPLRPAGCHRRGSGGRRQAGRCGFLYPPPAPRLSTPSSPATAATSARASGSC